MRKILYSITLLSCFCFSTIHAETTRGRVVGISDGVTVKVLDSENNLFTIRLMGIDAPEKAQPFGQSSK